MSTNDTAHSESVREHARFDSGPGKFRIGLLVLSNDYVMERDFINMRPSDDVAIFTSRLPKTPDCTVETLREMAPHISNTTSLLVPEGRLDVVAYGCMRFLPGTHTNQKVEHNETFADDSALTRGQEIALDIDENKAVPVVLDAGQISLHHCLLFRASGPNCTEDTRIGLAVRYPAFTIWVRQLLL